MKTMTKVLNTIAALNLEPIKNKLMDAESGEGWSRAKVEAMDLEYRRFLHLMHSFPNQPASPTKAVDTFWHYHILDTQKYAADCDLVFGCFMHHNPYGDEQSAAPGAEAGEERVDLMQEMYEATFGEAYIRPEVYMLDEVGAAGAKTAPCDSFCMMQAAPASAKPAAAKSARCHTFCMMQAGPSDAKAARCHTFCMMQAQTADARAEGAKPAGAQTAGARAARCHTFCMMQAKPAKPARAAAARCHTFCMMQANPAKPAKPASAAAARCHTFCMMQAEGAAQGQALAASPA